MYRKPDVLYQLIQFVLSLFVRKKKIVLKCLSLFYSPRKRFQFFISFNETCTIFSSKLKDLWAVILLPNDTRQIFILRGGLSKCRISFRIELCSKIFHLTPWNACRLLHSFLKPGISVSITEVLCLKRSHIHWFFFIFILSLRFRN